MKFLNDLPKFVMSERKMCCGDGSTEGRFSMLTLYMQRVELYEIIIT